LHRNGRERAGQRTSPVGVAPDQAVARHIASAAVSLDGNHKRLAPDPQAPSRQRMIKKAGPPSGSQVPDLQLLGRGGVNLRALGYEPSAAPFKVSGSQTRPVDVTVSATVASNGRQ
jgi:hypothetical protein